MAQRVIRPLRSGRVATYGNVALDRSRLVSSQHRAATETYLIDLTQWLDGDTIRQFVVHPQNAETVATVDLDSGLITVRVTGVVDRRDIQIRVESTTRRDQFSLLLVVNELAGDIPVSAPFSQTIIEVSERWYLRGVAEVQNLSVLLAEDESGGFDFLATEAGDPILTEVQP